MGLNGAKKSRSTSLEEMRLHAREQQQFMVIHYRHGIRRGLTEVHKYTRIDAIGNVRILSPQQTAQGTRGVYIINQGLMILTGAPKLFSGSDEITAQDSLEFWDEKDLLNSAWGGKSFEGREPIKGRYSYRAFDQR